MKLKVGKKAPDFTLPSHLEKDITLSELQGKTVIIAFYPLAWTPVWTAQIPSYEALKTTFEELNVQVLGISVDHVPCLQAWQESLGGITYPLLSDFWPHGKIAKEYGVLRENEGKSERAIFIIDKEGIIRYIDIHDIDEQPDNDVLLAELKKFIPNASEAINKLYIERAEEEGGILMYCTPWCPDCPKVRKWFQENNIEYTEIDISRDLNAARQVRSWGNGYQITPTFNINGEIIVDYQKEKLEKLLLKK